MIPIELGTCRFGHERGISLGFSSILVPAIAQSIAPDALSMRRSTKYSPTERTIVSVVSSGTSGTQRREIRVEKLLFEPSMAPVADMISVVWESFKRDIRDLIDGDTGGILYYTKLE
jgi:hypothetical protein